MSFFLIVQVLFFFCRECAHPVFTIRGMFEYRIFAPGKTTAFKTTYFYGREPRFEQAWDAIAVYALNDSRWKDNPNVLNNIAGVARLIEINDCEAWFPFVYGI